MTQEINTGLEYKYNAFWYYCQFIGITVSLNKLEVNGVDKQIKVSAFAVPACICA